MKKDVFVTTEMYTVNPDIKVGMCGELHCFNNGNVPIRRMNVSINDITAYKISFKNVENPGERIVLDVYDIKPDEYAYRLLMNGEYTPVFNIRERRAVSDDIKCGMMIHLTAKDDDDHAIDRIGIVSDKSDTHINLSIYTEERGIVEGLLQMDPILPDNKYEFHIPFGILEPTCVENPRFEKLMLVPGED